MRVLIINSAGIGDFFELIRWLYLIKKQKNNYIVDLVVSKRVYDYAKDSPYIDEVFFLDTSAESVLFSLSNLKTVMTLRKRSYDLIINTFPTDRFIGDVKFAFLRFFLKKKGTTFIGPLRKGRYKVYDVNIETDCFDYKEIFKTINIVDEDIDVKKLLWKKGTDRFELEYYFLNNPVFINPFSNSSLRNLPAKLWVDFIEKFVANFNFQVILNGKFKWLLEIYERLSEPIKDKIYLSSGVDVYRWIYLIDRSQFVLSVDTAVVHISSILGKNTVVVIPEIDYEIHKPYRMDLVRYVKLSKPYDANILMDFIEKVLWKEGV